MAHVPSKAGPPAALLAQPVCRLEHGQIVEANAAWVRAYPSCGPLVGAFPGLTALPAALDGPAAQDLSLPGEASGTRLRLSPMDASGARWCLVEAPPLAEFPGELEHRFRWLVARTSDAIFIKNLDGYYVFANEAAARAVGRTVDELLDSSDEALFGPEAAREIRAVDQQVIESRQAVCYQPIRRMNGDERVFLTTKYPYDDAAGRPAGILGISHDVTDWVAAREAAEAAQQDAALGRVAAGLAHEINNPLMLLLTELSSARRLAAAANRAGELDALQGALTRAEQAGARVMALSQVVLGGAAERPPARSPVSVAQALHRAVQGLPAGLRARVDLKLDLPVDLAPAWTDEGLLTAVLTLLVQRAMERSLGSADGSPGVVHASARVRGEEVELRLQDWGPALSSAELQAAFDARAEADGVPLRLWSAWRLVQNLGGKVELLQPEGGGSALRLCVPKAPAPAPPALPAATAPARARLLVVDDEDALLRLLADALSLDAEVATAASGAEALALLQSGLQPDLILCDLMMPQMTGIALHAHLLAQGSPLADRMVFMTGGAFTPEARDFVEAHSTRMLKKPFRLATLRASLGRWLEALAVKDPAAPAPG